MARCYHDNQDFKSDLNIEVAREGDILKEGQDLKDIECAKNPGHRDFIPFKDLTLNHLPIEHRNKKTFDGIKNIGCLVVRLVVDKIKNGRLTREVGSGCVIYCKRIDRIENGRIKKGAYLIKTNNHIVKTDDEVKRCTVEFHYDDDSRSSVLCSRGAELVRTCPYRDFTLFTFHPVPDFVGQHDSKDKLLRSFIVIMYKDNRIETKEEIGIYSRSSSKFSSFQNLNSPLNYLMCITNPDGTLSYLKSSFFKYQPISSKKQQLTSINVYRDGDDGNSRVISGDVVIFGDEFVVKISESIFQDEVKKCRLVLNGEVIGRGTRLYFPQVDAREVFKGIELEEQIILGRENLWIFNFYPIPRDLEGMLQADTTSNMCCIGHPHGGIKMVTFGKLIGVFLEKFDHQNRHIIKRDSHCQCKKVNCAKYTCKTCLGSSGSPVFLLGNILANRFVHFMGKSEVRYLYGEKKIENENTAWSPTTPS